MGARSREDNLDVTPIREAKMEPTVRARASGELIAWPLLRFQHFGAGCCLELTGVDRHGEHHIVADRTGKLQQLVVAET